MAAYSFLDVVAAIAGPGGSFNLGYGAANAEEGITVTMTEEKNDMKVGADGAVMHSLRAGQSGKATVRLLKTSPTNALLDAMLNEQRQSSLTWGQNVITISDVARGDTYVCSQVAFSKQPDVTWAKDGNTIEWEFDVGVVDPQLGVGVADLLGG